MHNTSTSRTVIKSDSHYNVEAHAWKSESLSASASSYNCVKLYFAVSERAHTRTLRGQRDRHSGLLRINLGQSEVGPRQYCSAFGEESIQHCWQIKLLTLTIIISTFQGCCRTARSSDYAASLPTRPAASSSLYFR